ncbi:MAG: ECF transporter S component [Oscillospiraceae bacterium]
MHTKWTARRLAADAMFAAMVTVLGLVSISTGNLKITVEALPVFLGALLLGPVDGLAIGGVGTLLYQLLRFGVSATTALWIAPYVLLGLCVGAVSARHGYDCTPRQLALLAVLGELGITVLNTGSLYLDSLIYGYYSPVFVFGTLPPAAGHLRGKRHRARAAAADAAARHAPRAAAAYQLKTRKPPPRPGRRFLRLSKSITF